MGEPPADDDEWGIPDVLLPEQLETLASRLANTPSKRLWFAVLVQAIIALDRGARDRFAIWAWVASEADGLCTFVGICEALEIDTERLRPVLLEMASRPRGRPTKRRGTTAGEALGEVITALAAEPNSAEGEPWQC